MNKNLYENKRKKYRIKKIIRDKKQLSKDIIVVASNALIVGATTLGVILHGENYLREVITDSGCYDLELQGAATGISMSVGMLALYFVKQNSQNIKKMILEEKNNSEEEKNQKILKKEKTR